ncbi:MAG: 30S ribosomal protein S6 [Fastidiosipilaceae bacterium]|jgi:small subunit ribosomal protein S6
MNEYEMVYILNPVLGEESVTALNERVKSLIEANGELADVDEWGRKRLAYEIQDQREGIYYLANFSANADAPREIERVMRITEGVLRYLIIRKGD